MVRGELRAIVARCLGRKWSRGLSLMFGIRFVKGLSRRFDGGAVGKPERCAYGQRQMVTRFTRSMMYVFEMIAKQYSCLDLP